MFDFLGNLLGYVLWALFYVFKNYGVAIILFTIITKAILFPLTINRQKSMASQTKMAAKQKELQEKYGKNQQKYQEELQKLYDKEGASPYSGCLPMLLPFPILFGIIATVRKPLSNILHIGTETVEKAVDFISRIPGSTSAANNYYMELEVLRKYDILKDQLDRIFSQDSPVAVERVEMLANGFNFFGLDLKLIPSGAPFTSFIWIIPVLSLVISIASSFYSQYTNRKMGQPDQQGCMKAFMFLMPLISVYYVYITPAAVGIYWVMSSLVSTIENYITNHFYSVAQMTAKTEAQREMALVLKEETIRPLPIQEQRQIEKKIEESKQAQISKEANQKAKANKQKKSTGKQKNNSNNTSDYRGNKK